MPETTLGKRKHTEVNYDDDRDELLEELNDEGGVEAVKAEMDKSDVPEGIPYKGVLVRPSWYSGIYDILANFSKKREKGKIMCGICSESIKVDIDGDEVYHPDLHYKNPGRPHIDHYNLVWSARLKKIDLANKGGTWGVGKYKSKLREAFNSPGLQIAHKQCNLKKGDAKNVTNGFYDKCTGEIIIYLNSKK